MAGAIITKAEAIASGKTRYFTGEPCSNGHVDERYVSNNICRVCSLERSKKYRDENKNVINARKLEKYKKNPEHFRRLSMETYFRKHDAYTEKSRKYYARNAQRLRAYASEYRRKYPEVKRAGEQTRRARKANSAGRHTKADIDRIFKSQRHCCASCHRKLTKYHIDHIMPLALGGSNDSSNIQILCPACNMRKNKRDPFEWAKMNGKLI